MRPSHSLFVSANAIRAIVKTMRHPARMLPPTVPATFELPVAHRRRLGGTSKVSGTVRGTVKAALRIGLTFVRVACERRHRLTAAPDRVTEGKS